VKGMMTSDDDGGRGVHGRDDVINVFASSSCFKKNNLDGLFIVTNAPGRSAYNRVERRIWLH